MLFSDALARAAQRNVGFTLLLEREIDNPSYHHHGEPFPGLRAGSPGRQLIAPGTSDGSVK